MIINAGSSSLPGSDEDSELILIDEEKAFDRAAAIYSLVKAKYERVHYKPADICGFRAFVYQIIINANHDCLALYDDYYYQLHVAIL